MSSFGNTESHRMPREPLSHGKGDDDCTTDSTQHYRCAVVLRSQTRRLSGLHHDGRGKLLQRPHDYAAFCKLKTCTKSARISKRAETFYDRRECPIPTLTFNFIFHRCCSALVVDRSRLPLATVNNANGRNATRSARLSSNRDLKKPLTWAELELFHC